MERAGFDKRDERFRARKARADALKAARCKPQRSLPLSQVLKWMGWAVVVAAVYNWVM